MHNLSFSLIKYQIHGRIGHLEEAARDLSAAVEMSEEDDVKANLCQKLVSAKLIFSGLH